MFDYNSQFDINSSSLVSLGWDERAAAGLAEAAPELLPGRVVRVERGACMLALGEDDQPARSAVPVAVGDWVGARWNGSAWTVEMVAPRWSQLTRRDPEGLTQVLAANIDIVFVTVPADRFSAARVERETMVAWDSGAVPVILLTKLDVAEPGLVEQLRARLVGVEVLATSTVTGEGVGQVVALLRPGRTAVLLGPSGAGKSSLANVLLGAEKLAVGSVRDGDRRGRHTTSVRQLLAVPTGGVLIDTPGVRSLSLAGGDGLASTFADIVDLATGCRFSDCRHEQEPGCAVSAAVETGELDPRRLANYHKLRRELGFQSRRDDPIARAQAERVWKIRAKAARQLNRSRTQRR